MLDLIRDLKSMQIRKIEILDDLLENNVINVVVFYEDGTSQTVIM